MVETVRLTDPGLRIHAEVINGYNYIYGVTTPIYYRADITRLMEARSADEAVFVADMLRCISARAIKEVGKPIDYIGDADEPLDGCAMVCFYEPGKGKESARVVLQHPQHEVIAYERTINMAIHKANEAMKKLLKL